MRLPGEIRNTIYRYVSYEGRLALKTFPQIPKHKPSVLRLFRGESQPNQIALLYVCRRLNEEACVVPFSVNKFDFGTLDQLELFHVYLTQAQRAAIGSVCQSISIGEYRTFAHCITRFKEQGIHCLHDILPRVSTVYVKATMNWAYISRRNIPQSQIQSEKDNVARWLQQDGINVVFE